MFENLRKKSLVKTYNDPRYSINFEQGHVIYLDSFSFAQHKQILSKKKVEDKSFPSTFDGVSKEFRVLANTLKDVQFNMIYCPKGTFEMGHIDQDDNKPRQETIERPFLLGETEITQELYEKVMGDNPSNFKNAQKPVEWVSWEDAIKFCNTSSALQGLEECYTKKSNDESEEYWDCDFSKNGYRLPREKEWEYAAKAGTENQWAGTNDKDKLGKYAWFDGNSKIDGKKQTHSVKTKKPNEWGFYDMSGNVREWCWDKYNSKVLDISATRVARGGSWWDYDLNLCSAYRNSNSPNRRDEVLGFRVCRSIVN